jgi:hypothetical protein
LFKTDKNENYEGDDFLFHLMGDFLS